MIKYEVVLSKKAQKRLDKLPDIIATPILDEILYLKIIHALLVTKN